MKRVLSAVLCSAALAAPALSFAATDLSSAARDVLEGRQEIVRFQVVGPLAEQLQRQLNSASPVFAEVKAIRSYPGANCKRLRIHFTVPDAVAIDPSSGKPKSFYYTQEMDTCSDGSAPSVR
jgi:hypothetical protein